MSTKLKRRAAASLAVAGALASLTASVLTQRYANPVLPGDHPDPSIIRVGESYWATATTAQWAPLFPLLTSRDLVNWTQVGSVFPKPPEWTAGSYWAPEIAEDRGRFFVYYTARKAGGPLCVAAATATSPGGPYTDHGPLVCQEAGSIDAVAVTDEHGTRHLVWKEDGNSRKQPTPLWAQPLSDDGTRLVGEPRKIFSNEVPWEAHVIEGAFFERRGEWFYLFYSADACCGRRCNYKLGVARARALAGPWERHPNNPILAANERWKCPGHGSLVSVPDGRTFLLYHAYDPDNFDQGGRQGLLDEVTWGADGWPAINGGHGPSRDASLPFALGRPAVPRDHEERRPSAASYLDEFTTDALSPGWQWPWNREPTYRVDPDRTGTLLLSARQADGSLVGSLLSRSTSTSHYVATTRIEHGELAVGVRAGLVVYGDPDNAIGISVARNQAVVWVREKGMQRQLAVDAAPASRWSHLRLTSTKAARLQFAISADGREWRAVGPDEGHPRPQDRATRVALTVAGPPGAAARIDWLRIDPVHE